MSQVTQNDLKEILGAAMSNQPRLKTITDGANAKRVSMDNAAKAALIVANLMFSQNQPGSVAAAAAVRTFEAVLYKDVSAATGIQFDAASHNELTNAMNQAIEFVQKANGSNNNSGNPFLAAGGSSNNPFLANTSAGNSNSNNPFLANNNAGNTANNPFLNANQASPAQDENIFTSAPPAAAEPAKPAIATADTKAQVVTTQQPKKAGTSMESYRDHELVVDYATQAQPPRKTNESLKQFKLSGDWAERVRQGLSEGKLVITFDNAEIMCKVNDDHRTFIGYNAETKDKFDEMLAVHAQELGNMEGLEEEDDVQVIMKTVNTTIAKLRDNAVAYYRHLDSLEVPNTLKMDVSAMVACYLNRLEELVVKGFTIGSDQCRTPDGRRFVIKNTFGDLADFADSVFNHYCDNNGLCKEPDYFRELFLSVGAQLKKLRITLQETGEMNIEIFNVQIVTAGNYANYEKENVVTVSSFGPLAEVISAIYEAVIEKMPFAAITVQLPTGSVEVLQSLELGAPIRY